MASVNIPLPSIDMLPELISSIIFSIFLFLHHKWHKLHKKDGSLLYQICYDLVQNHPDQQKRKELNDRFNLESRNSHKKQ
jgi:hypothetical protein